MSGPDAGHAGERSFRDFFRLPLTKENRRQLVDPACRLCWDLVNAWRPHVRYVRLNRALSHHDALAGSHRPIGGCFPKSERASPDD
jgi:hypothetical protein